MNHAKDQHRYIDEAVRALRSTAPPTGQVRHEGDGLVWITRDGQNARILDVFSVAFAVRPGIFWRF